MLQGQENSALYPQDSKLILCEMIMLNCLDALFRMKFANGNEFVVPLNGKNVYKLVYLQNCQTTIMCYY